MLKIVFTSKMKKDLKLANKRGYKLEKLTKVLDMLVQQETLPEKYKDHQLGGDYTG